MATKKVEQLPQNFALDYSSILDKVERASRLNGGSSNQGKTFVSTGMLVEDFILDGGLQPGTWNTFFGPEQSAKSTNVMSCLKSAVIAEIENLLYFDYEGSTSGSPDYFENILGNNMKMEDVFGLKDDSGKWVIRPKARLYVEDVAERFFDSMASFLRRLPDKVLLDGQWYFVFDPTNENRKLVGGEYSKKLFTEYKQLYVPTQDSRPQAMIFLDSYMAMQPEKENDDDAGGQGLAVLARMFAENIRKVSSKLKRKSVILLGVNQLREVPMARGNPEREPGGQALKFASSVRVRQYGRAVPHANGPYEEEKAIWDSGGIETYRYIHMRAIKNKVGVPNREGWFRLCIEDSFGNSTGFDPVYDTFQYLKMTGQVSGTMKKMALNVAGINNPKNKLAWPDFKALILLQGSELREHCKDIGLEKTLKLRDLCFKQMRLRESFGMYYDTKRNKADSASDDDD